MRKTLLRTGIAAVAVSLTLTTAACSPPAKKLSGSSKQASSATSAQDLGGMTALVTAAKKEGTLNLIAIPPDWAYYSAITAAFTKKYGIKLNTAQPDGSSQDEINAANQLKGQSKAPDVFDLSQTVATANTKLFAPYKVTEFDQIPSNLKDAGGTYTNDYGGYMSIGYNSQKVPAPKTVSDLLKPVYKGKVALNGNPTQAGAAFAGVMMASLGNGGSASSVDQGVAFFKKLKAAGNFLPVDPTPATIASGQTPVVLDWDYLNVVQGQEHSYWKTVIPSGAVLGGYYVQAISANAPHPAAARLWEEFLYSDEGQNLWLKGGARPVRLPAMVKAGTVDKTAYADLPKVSGTPVFLTQAQSDKAASYLTANWSKAIS